MKRISKAILLLAALLIILAVAAVFGLNWYAQRPETRARLQAELSDALGLPVEITRLTAGLTGLEISGVRIPGGPQNLLEADSFSATYRILPLLQHRVELSRLTLQHPHVIWAQNAEGKWVLPILPEKGQRDKLPNADRTKPAEPKGSNYTVVLGRLEIVEGTLELLDAERKRVAVASGVQIDYTLHADQTATGSLTAKQFAWINYPAFSDLTSPLTYAHGELKFTEVHGAVSGGTVQGAASIQAEATGTPFSAQLKLERVDLGRLTTEAGWRPDQATGTLAGDLDWHGAFGDLDHAQMKGHLTVADAKFHELDLFQTIGQILQIPELAELRVHTGFADFLYGDGQTKISQLQLDATDLVFGAQGSVKTDGKLALNATLSVNEKLARQLPSFVRSNFTPAAGGGSQIAFDISGRTDKPRTNLLNRVIGQQVTGQLDDLLGSVFGGKKDDKKDDKEKKKKDKDKKKDKEKPADPPAAAEPAAPGTP